MTIKFDQNTGLDTGDNTRRTNKDCFDVRLYEQGSL